MKCIILALSLLSLLALTFADTKVHSRGCIYILGQCKEECPEGTRAYATGCDHKLPEATCDQPKPELEDGIICDYSACYCEPPTVRNSITKQCVPLEECPKKNSRGTGYN